MAKVIRGNESVDITDGDSIKEACRRLDVLFGCESGLCGTCILEIVEGAQNLSERTEAEEAMGLPDNHRLACQCRLLHGSVKIRY